MAAESSELVLPPIKVLLLCSTTLMSDLLSFPVFTVTALTSESNEPSSSDEPSYACMFAVEAKKIITFGKPGLRGRGVKGGASEANKSIFN